MRVTRAFVGSVGAGLCLVAASVCALFVLSAVVAVRGWPGINPENDVPRVTLADARLAAADGPDAGGVALAVAASPGASPIVLGGLSPSAGEGSGRSGSPEPRRDRAAGGRMTAPAASAPGSGSTGALQRSGRPAAPSQPSAPGNPVSDTIRDSGDDVGDTVDPVAPGAGSTITEVTDTVAGAVENVGNGNGGGAVQETTDRTGQAVRDTGSAVDDATKDAAETAGNAVGGLVGAGN